MKIKNRVYITATSSVSCTGENDETLFSNVCNGVSGLEQDKNFFLNATPSIGKLATSSDFYDALYQQCKNILTAKKMLNFKNTLLVIGSSVGGMQKTEEIFFRTNSYKDIDPDFHNIHTIATLLNQKFNFYDDISFSTACTSSANALGYAHEVLSKGLYENVLVVGVDSLSATTVGGFLSLGVLSSNTCTPFDVDRDGMNVAEAIACLFLETEASSNTAIEVCGVGYSSDAYHMTHPHPDGNGAKEAMQKALTCASLKAEKIDYINAHGTGTMANDSAEGNAIASLFSHKPYVSSTKSITGHTLGAAGALEAILSCFAIQKQMVFGNSLLKTPDNTVLNLPTVSMKSDITYVLSNSFAFGGNNTSLIFGKVV